MANNFSSDSRCKALWRFESGALTADSKGTNTLTNHSGAESSGAGGFKEGACAADFELSSSTYLQIADASLDAGFPLKSGDTTKTISACFWIKPETVSGTQRIFAKYTVTGDKRSLGIGILSNKVWIAWGVGTGAVDYSPGPTLVVGQWYHISVVIDGVNKSIVTRIWDETAGITYDNSYTPAAALYVGDASLTIGTQESLINFYDGILDELVVFNALLSSTEIDQIRAGTFGVYEYVSPGIPLSLTPQTASAGAHEYAGNILLRLNPIATYELGVVGVPLAVIGSVPIKIAVAGTIAFASPAVTALVGSVALQVDPTGVIDFGVSTAVIGSVEIKVRPAGVISELAPVINATIGSVKLGIGVRGMVNDILPVAPPVLAIIGSVGIGINATGVVGGVTPSTLAVIGSVEIRIGEFRVPELTVVQLLSPADLTLAITGSVGMEVGPAGVIALSATPPTYAVPPSRSIDAPTINIRVAGVIALIHPQILEVIGDIEVDVGVGGGAVDPGVFDTYALTGIRGEPSIYSNFPFNSYASYRGQDFGAGPEGIYLLEGEDDAGAEIHSGVRIGPVNFSTDREKRLRLLRLGGKTVGSQVKVSNGNGSIGYYDVEGGRAGVSREVQGREITIDISNFDTLDHLEIVPLVLAKR